MKRMMSMKSLCPSFTNLCTCVFLLFLSSFAQAQAKDGLAGFFTVSKSGAYLFKMVQGKTHEADGKTVVDQSAKGTAYALQADGTMTELWSVNGWLLRPIFLADDGETLVRLVPSHTGRKASKTDLAIAFYKHGELVREYFTGDLVKQSDAVKASRAGYSWLAPVWVTATDSRKADGTSRITYDREAEPLLDGAGIFRVKTIDGITYQFEASTGKLLKRTVPGK
jgi:muconolactone delta-isomerase